jgi:starch synthase
MPVLTAANLVQLQREVDDPTAPAARPGVSTKALFVTPESTDFLQAGGLGEVSAALPRALRPSCDARVLIPAYRPALRDVASMDIVAHLPGAGAIPPCSIGALTLPGGLVVYLVLCSELYDRDGSPYADAAGAEFADNAIRFARLSLAAAELTMRGVGGWRPDILHLNDWPTALAAGYLRWRGDKTPTVVTIHNLAHQGQFDARHLAELAIPASAFHVDGVEFYGRISFLKTGLVYADHVTTVCATYAEEIARPEFGCGLNGVLTERASEGRLTGIRNGVDPSWDPRADQNCPYRFDARRWKERYADYVRGAFGLDLSSGPLFAFVARLVHQKGVDLVLEASETIVARGGQIVIVGRGEPEAERAAAELARRHRRVVGAHIGFDPDEARAVFAGADFVLMPSRYEPCGLSQMYAQRFGALPIAHRTGGLAETIDEGRTGFLFGRLDIAAFASAIDDAFAVYQAPVELQTMRRAAMAKDFSWAASAAAYGALYRKLGEARGAKAKPETAKPAPRPAATRAAPRVVDEDFTAAASRADARALQRLAAAAAASIGRRTPRG